MESPSLSMVKKIRVGTELHAATVHERSDVVLSPLRYSRKEVAPAPARQEPASARSSGRSFFPSLLFTSIKWTNRTSTHRQHRKPASHVANRRENATRYFQAVASASESEGYVITTPQNSQHCHQQKISQRYSRKSQISNLFSRGMARAMAAMARSLMAAATDPP